MRTSSKKIISLILVFTLLFSMSYSAFAAAAEGFADVSVTFTSDKKQYKSGEEIKLKTKIKNVTGQKQYVSVSYRATPFARFDDVEKYNVNYAEVENEADAEFLATAKATHSVFSTEWMQDIYDAVFGSFWSSVYLIMSMFNSRYEPISIKVDGVPAVILAEVDACLSLPEEPTEPSEPTEPTEPIEPGYVSLKYDLGSVSVDNFKKTQILKIGETPTEPLSPESNGYLFAGWYKDNNYKEPYYFDSEITSNTVVYARWIEKPKNSEVKLSPEDSLEIINNVFSETKNGTASKELIAENDNVITGVKVDYQLKKGTGSVKISAAMGAINNTFSKVGEAVDIDLIGFDELEKAQIVFSYDEKLFSNDISEDDLGIIWFDEANNKMVLLDNAVIDKDNNTISVETEHFSKYVVVNTDKWISNWEHKQLVSRIDGKTVRFNIVLCLDDSGSMSGTARDVCQQAARNFVDQLVDGDNIAVIKFNSGATTLVYPTEIINNGITNNKETIKNQIVLRASGGTNFNSAIDSAISLLNIMPKKTLNNEILKNYIVFLSDGQSTVGDNQITELVKWGYNVLAIGVGGSVSASELQKLASQSGGSYAHVSNPNDIGSIFEQLQGEYIGLSVDSDGDGIADLVEKTGMIALDGNIYRTDPNNADTDGDGISDGVEMGVYDDSLGYFIVESDPTTPTNTSSEYSVDFSVTPEYASNDCITLDSYMHIKAKIKIHVLEGHRLAWDYLSDTKYEDVDGLKIELYEDGKPLATYGATSVALETGRTIEFSPTIDLSADMKEHKYSIEVTTSNAGNKSDEISYSPYQKWISTVDAIMKKTEEEFQRKSTKAVQICSKKIKDCQENVKDAVIILYSGIDIGTDYKIAQQLIPEFQKIFGQRIVDTAKSLAQKTSSWSTKDADDVIKSVANLCSSNPETFDVVIGRYTYRIKTENFPTDLVGTFTAYNTTTNKEFQYVFSADTAKINSVINNYMDACRNLYNEAIDDCIDATINDAMSILSLDQLGTFFNKKMSKKIGGYFDAVMDNYGVGLRYNDVKSCYETYEKAKEAIDSVKAAGENANTRKTQKAIDSISGFLSHVGNLSI